MEPTIRCSECGSEVVPQYCSVCAASLSGVLDELKELLGTDDAEELVDWVRQLMAQTDLDLYEADDLRQERSELLDVLDELMEIVGTDDAEELVDLVRQLVAQTDLDEAQVRKKAGL